MSLMMKKWNPRTLISNLNVSQRPALSRDRPAAYSEYYDLQRWMLLECEASPKTPHEIRQLWGAVFQVDEAFLDLELLAVTVEDFLILRRGNRHRGWVYPPQHHSGRAGISSWSPQPFSTPFKYKIHTWESHLNYLTEKIRSPAHKIQQ